MGTTTTLFDKIVFFKGPKKVQVGPGSGISLILNKLASESGSESVNQDHDYVDPDPK